MKNLSFVAGLVYVVAAVVSVWAINHFSKNILVAKDATTGAVL